MLIVTIGSCLQVNKEAEREERYILELFEGLEKAIKEMVKESLDVV